MRRSRLLPIAVASTAAATSLSPVSHALADPAPAPAPVTATTSTSTTTTTTTTTPTSTATQPRLPATLTAEDIPPMDFRLVWQWVYDHVGPGPEPTRHPALVPDDEVAAKEAAAAGAAPAPAVAAAPSAAASYGDCDPLRYCAWTGGAWSGPSINFIVGRPLNWGNFSEPVCASSGTSGAIWKNCASSLRNRSAAATAHYFVLPNGSGYELTEGPFGADAHLGVFRNNIDSSIAL